MFVDIGINREHAQKYALAFSENEIDQNVYGELNHELLTSIGVNILGDRIKILKHLKQSQSRDNYLSDIKILGKIGGGNFGRYVNTNRICFNFFTSSVSSKVFGMI